MIKLTQFIYEALTKQEIKSSVKEVNDLTSIFLDLGLAKTRTKTWTRCVKKVLGTNSSLYVASSMGNEKSNIEAMKAILDKGMVQRAVNTPFGKDFFVTTGIDYSSSNAEMVKNKEYWSEDEYIKYCKKNMTTDLSRNAYIKKVGITTDVKKQIEEICDKFANEFKSADHENTYLIKDKDGDLILITPVLFVIGKKVVKSICIGEINDISDKKYSEKVKNNKCMIIFAKDDIDNMEDEE